MSSVSAAVISQVGVEDPILHIVEIDNVPMNVAIELKSIVLLGASTKSNNSEYRRFNVSTQRANSILQGSTGSASVTALFKRVQAVIVKKLSKTAPLRAITTNGIGYAIIYYLLFSSCNYSTEYLVGLNAFVTTARMIEILQDIMDDAKLRLSKKELGEFAAYALEFSNESPRVGSKLLPITRFQIRDATNLSETIWKSMYINTILRSMSTERRGTIFSPMVDWGLVRCVTKRVLTDDNLVNRVLFGENMNFIKTTAAKQSSVAANLAPGSMFEIELGRIRALTAELTTLTSDINYDLSGLLFAMFYNNAGDTLYSSINAFKEGGVELAGIFANHDAFKSLVFQYLYAVYLLADIGVIHNDPHLNNILITPFDGKKREFILSDGDAISLTCPFGLTIIDFDKSILSHYHHNNFSDAAKDINQELAIVFKEVKRTIVDNMHQVFGCYVMYDTLRFGLILKQLLEELQEAGQVSSGGATRANMQFLNSMIKISIDTLHRIYDNDAKFPFDIMRQSGSIEWLISSLYKPEMKIHKTKSSAAKLQRGWIQKSLSDNKPEFVSSRRKYADMLKYDFIAQYSAQNNF